MEFERRDWIACLLFVGVTVGFFFEFVFQEQNFVAGRWLTETLPLASYLSEQMQGGNLPLWDSVSIPGRALLANPDFGLFHPFQVFFLLPETRGVLVSLVISHYFMAAFFMFLLIRRLGCRVRAAWLSGIVYAFSGYMISRHGYFKDLSALIWPPLILLLFHFAILRSERRLAFLASLIAAVQALTQHWALVGLTWILLLLWTDFVTPEAPKRPQRWGEFFGSFFFLAAIGLWPLAEMCLRNRSLVPLTDCFLLPPPLGFERGAELLFPHFFDLPFPAGLYWGQGPWEFGLFSGVFSLVLSSCTIAAPAELRRICRFFLGLFCLGLFLTFFWSGVMGGFFLTFGLAALTGFGLETLLQRSEQLTPPERDLAIRWFQRAAWTGGVAAGLWTLLFLLRSHWADSLPPGAALHLLKSTAFGIFLLFATSLLLLKRLQVRHEEFFFDLLVVIVLLWELFHFGKKAIPSAPRDLLPKEPAVLRMLPDRSHVRILRQVSIPDVSAPVSEEDLPHAPFFRERFLWDTLGGHTYLGHHVPVFEDKTFSAKPEEVAGWGITHLLLDAAHADVWLHSTVPLEQVGSVKDGKVLLYRLREPTNPDHLRVQEGMDVAAAGRLEAWRLSASGEHLVLESRAAVPTELRIGERHDPLWRIFLNGQEVSGGPRAVDGQMALPVGRGQNHIELHYRPETYRLAAATSFSALVALLVFLLHPFSWKTLIRAFSLSGLRRD